MSRGRWSNFRSSCDSSVSVPSSAVRAWSGCVVRTAHNTEINSWPAYVKGVVLWSYRRTRPRAILMSLRRGFLLFVRGLAPLLTALRERRTFLDFLRGAANRRTTFLDFLFLAEITTGSTSGA